MISATRVSSRDDTTAALIMLHGIFGRGRNLQGIARAVVAARPAYACWLIDLPHHGDSPAGAHGDTIHGLAADVDAWLATSAIVPDAVLGHSYGGKVALALAASRPAHHLQLWIIDSTPEVKTPAGSAWTMIDVVRRLPARFRSRDEAIAGLTAAGYDLGVAQWMATNLTRTPEGLAWRLDFAAMERLLRDFFDTDLWPVVEAASPNHTLHIVKASGSNAISQSAVARLERAAPAGRVHVHHRKGGHWIHAESPQLIVDLLVEGLPPPGAVGL